MGLLWFIAGFIGGVVVRELAPIVPWLIKRKVQGTREQEKILRSIDFQKLIKEHLSAREMGNRLGYEVKLPELIQDHVGDVATLQGQCEGLMRDCENVVSWALQSDCTLSMLLEQYAKGTPLLEQARESFAISFKEFKEICPAAIDNRPELSKKVMFAYYEWVVNPNDANEDALQHVVTEMTDAINRRDLEIAES